MTRHLRDGLSQRRIVGLLVLGGVLLAAALILPRLERPVAGVATLDQCHWGWPVVAFEGETWRSALPDDVRSSAPREIPIVQWPSGLRFDEAAGALLDAQGGVVFRKGDRVRIQGSVVEVDGDPAPCFITIGVKVDAITTP